MTFQPFGFSATLRRLRNLFASGDWLTRRDSRARRRCSVFVRHLDGGSCNDCELEIAALSNPIYDLERFGLHIVASPRHADVLLVTGPFTRSMEAAALAAFRAMPEPRRVVTAGDGFRPGGPWHGSYAVTALPQEMAPCWVAHVMGDPPAPAALLEALLALDTI